MGIVGIRGCFYKGGVVPQVNPPGDSDAGGGAIGPEAGSEMGTAGAGEVAHKKEGAPAGAPWCGKARSSQINVAFPYPNFVTRLIRFGSRYASQYERYESRPGMNPPEKLGSSTNS